MSRSDLVAWCEKMDRRYGPSVVRKALDACAEFEAFAPRVLRELTKRTVQGDVRSARVLANLSGYRGLDDAGNLQTLDSRKPNSFIRLLRRIFR